MTIDWHSFRDGQGFVENGWRVFLLLALVVLMAPTKAAGDVKADKDGIKWESANGTAGLRFGGRVQYDFVLFDPDVTPLEDNNEIRRFSLFLSGKLAEDWGFRISGDLSERSGGWTTVWLRYTGFRNTAITMGNAMAPFGLEDQIPSNNSKFVERSLSNIFTLGLETGLFVSHHSDDWTISGAVVNDPIDVYEEKNLRTKIGVVGRYTWAPIRKRRKVLHFGLSAGSFKVDEGSKYSYSPRPEVGITSTRLVDTGNIEDVDLSFIVGVEVAWMSGPLLIQGEYVTDYTTLIDIQDLRFWGTYAQVAFVLTGERQRYSRQRGSFNRVRPKRNWGALEVTGRLSMVDLNSRDVFGGIQKNATVGLNWLIKRYFRFSANYIWMNVTSRELLPDERPSAFLCRFQVVY